jgi:hypothetical protein
MTNSLRNSVTGHFKSGRHLAAARVLAGLHRCNWHSLPASIERYQAA